MSLSRCPSPSSSQYLARRKSKSPKVCHKANDGRTTSRPTRRRWKRGVWRPSAPVLSAKLSSLLSLARICSYIHPAVRQTARPTVRVRVAVQPPSHDRILRSRSLSSFLLHFANCEFLISLNGRNISKFRDDDVGFACKWRAACLSYDTAQQQ